ncbi:zinc ABC transporter substrate-binding protein [Desulfosporosinus sp. PR]|uniref:metal ABC transporter solute-binding protein, Zn/Mn family n=1 Tax=Candidatus Desulfosporosinus nitrosoreducens TaxID=3401928 RepID=UPI0027FA279A|nr:zinc ABC transporter substrate-binding protein [Desulfosporosinus sp. PR]MDQ7093774.1 zinc ABC transporter substrate-binding protein [Desulfosporosinus sp. PR]
MKITISKWKLGLALTALAIGVLTGCGTEKPTAATGAAATQANSAGASGAKINVVAAENFYGEVAQAVGGDHVNVTSILTNPGQDPHDYEPTAETSKAVAGAQVVVYTGIGYDDWMERLLKADSSAKTKDVVAVGSDLLGKSAGDNPHVWYDLATMPKLASKLADDLGKLDPANSEDYQKRAKDYIATMAPLTDKAAKIKQGSPVSIDVSEPVFDYMAESLNLQVNNPKFALAVEEGNDPTASDYAQVQDDIKNHKIKLFVFNTQTDSPTVENIVKLAQGNSIPIIKVTETEPTGKNYIQWMAEQLDQVGNAFGIQ